MSCALLEVSQLNLSAPGGRPLFRDLNLTLGRDQVALIGRNGVGKSTLLELLATPGTKNVVHRTEPILVRQDLSNQQPNLHNLNLTDLSRESLAAGFRFVPQHTALSRGELRKFHLLVAKLRQPELLILDEPTEDLDMAGIDWLQSWLSTWPHGLILASHNKQLLAHFEHFFIIRESGCRYFPGSFEDLLEEQERADREQQQAYVRQLHVLVEREEHNRRVCRRRQRKKNVGRLREERRNPTKAQLKENKSYAQGSQGRAAKIRNARMDAVRGFTKAARRALAVNLTLELTMPDLSSTDRTLLQCCDLSQADLFRIELRLKQRERVAVIGPNGSGKTTLLQIMLQNRSPTTGTVRIDHTCVGSIEQGGTNWMLPESLIAALSATRSTPEATQTIVAHKFPLALAERPLRSLSPGERVRAALICLLQREPPVELLILDEPTYSLDFVGAEALTKALRAWPGALVVASHDRAFLTALQIDRVFDLGCPSATVQEATSYCDHPRSSHSAH